MRRVPIANGSTDKTFDKIETSSTFEAMNGLGGVIGNIIFEKRTYCLKCRHITSRRDGHARCAYCWVWCGRNICCMADDDSDTCAVGNLMDKDARAVRRKMVKRYQNIKETPVPDPECEHYITPPSRTEFINAKKAGKPLAAFKQNPLCSKIPATPKVPKKLPRCVTNQLDAWQLEEARMYLKPINRTQALGIEKVPLPRVYRQTAPNHIAVNESSDQFLDITAEQYCLLARHYRDQRRRARTWPQLYCSPMFLGDNTPTVLRQPDPAGWQLQPDQDETLVSESSGSGDAAEDFSDTDQDQEPLGEYEGIAAGMTTPPQEKKMKFEPGLECAPYPSTSYELTPKRSPSEVSSVTNRQPSTSTSANIDQDDARYITLNDSIAQGDEDTPFEARQIMNKDKHNSYDHLLDCSVHKKSKTVAYPIDDITELLNARLDEARRHILEYNEMEWPAHSNVLKFETLIQTHYNCAMPSTPGGLTRDQLANFSDYCKPSVLTTPSKVTISDILAMEEYANNMLNTTVASMTINQLCSTHNLKTGRPTDLVGRMLTQQYTILTRTRDMAINMLAWCVFARRIAQLTAKHKKTPVDILAKRCTVAWSEQDLLEW